MSTRRLAASAVAPPVPSATEDDGGPRGSAPAATLPQHVSQAQPLGEGEATSERGAEAEADDESLPDLVAARTEELHLNSVCDTVEFVSKRLLNMTVIVFAWRRFASLKRLMMSLQNAEYCGHTVPLKIFLDTGAVDDVVRYASEVAWPHGAKEVYAYGSDEPRGIRGMWMNATRADIADDEHILPLEDDLEVSPYFYWWLLRAARQYGPLGDASHVRSHGIVGVSLYTPRLNEIVYPQRKWLPDRVTAMPAFMLQVPCSWGALFFGSVWRDFVDFYRRRAAPPFFDFAQEARQTGVGKHREPLGDPALRLPRSRSNVWPRSWKRFLIDFMYGRGYVMLYPNLREQSAFSTTYMERGDHTAKDGLSESVQSHDLRSDVDPLKTTPLVTSESLSEAVAALGGLDGEALPDLAELPVFDIHHRRRTRSALVAQGFAFTENVRWWGERAAREAPDDPTLGRRYRELSDAWAGTPVQSYPTADGAAPPRVRGCALVQMAATAATDDDGGDDYDDDGGAADLRASGGDGGRRYLVYQPMSGVAEWLLSLHNAAGLARALNRTLVVPPMLWEGRADAPVPYSALYDIGPLRALMESDAAGLVEAAAFARLRLPPPSAIALLHVKDPRLHPSRAYFDRALGWENATGVHLSAQMASAADYDRLYGMCDERILALSHAYAAFDGWADGSAEQVWFDGALARAVWADLPPVSAAAAAVVNHLVKARGAFTCLHLTDLDNAVLTARSPTAAHLGGGGRGAPAGYDGRRGSTAGDRDGGGAQEGGASGASGHVDVAAPAARSVPYTGIEGGESYVSACESHDAEAASGVGRSWVRETYNEGYACRVDDDLVLANLAVDADEKLFVLADAGRPVPASMSLGKAPDARIDLLRLADLVAAAGANVSDRAWPAVEQAVCARASTIVANRYSPLSHLLARRARDGGGLSRRQADGDAPIQGGAATPQVRYWERVDFDACVPLFTRTARFEIQPNRFGILGQFGPERKLQLVTTNLTGIVGWDGRIVPNATLELDVYVSNVSHHLDVFEYTKETNRYGVNVRTPDPPGGWHSHTWHSISIPITSAHYSLPSMTPWGSMDRLELYYSAPHYSQPLGNYVRIRNVYMRSTRTFSRARADADGGSRSRRRWCRDAVAMKEGSAMHPPIVSRAPSQAERPEDGVPSEHSLWSAAADNQPARDMGGGSFRRPRATELRVLSPSDRGKANSSFPLVVVVFLASLVVMMATVGRWTSYNARRQGRSARLLDLRAVHTIPPQVQQCWNPQRSSFLWAICWPYVGHTNPAHRFVVVFVASHTAYLPH